MSARRCGSRVEGVVRSCDTAFRPGGNIIEHYVYRFVAAGLRVPRKQLGKIVSHRMLRRYAAVVVPFRFFFLSAQCREIISTDFGVLGGCD